MTGDWTLNERLAALAGSCPVFARDAFRFADTIAAERDGDIIVFGGVLYDDEAPAVHPDRL
jgi:hypothetical protein